MNLSHDYSRVGVYHNEMYYLGKYLKNRPLDLSRYVYDFLHWKDSGEILDRAGITKRDLKRAEANAGESDDIYELAEKIESVMSEDEKGEFASNIAFRNTSEAPPWAHMDISKERLPRNTWLVHFSDQSGRIVDEGFTKGISNLEYLAYTNHISDNVKKYGGYNFAFVAGNRYSLSAASKGSYGKGAVMFQSSGIEIYHHGDQENQVIYWGKAIDPKTIVELAKEDRDTWMVVPRWFKSSMSQKGREFVYKGTFSDVVNWVENNWFQYRKQIMGK